MNLISRFIARSCRIRHPIQSTPPLASMRSTSTTAFQPLMRFSYLAVTTVENHLSTRNHSKRWLYRNVSVRNFAVTGRRSKNCANKKNKFDAMKRKLYMRLGVKILMVN